ncbi:MAG: siphovirus Gp157 family protein [Clostridia bacterium]
MTDSLFQIDVAIQEMLELGFTQACVDQETGEIDDIALCEYFDKMCIDRITKIDNIASFIKNLEAQNVAIKEQEVAFAERRKSKEKMILRFQNYIKNSLLQTGDTKFETTNHALSFRKSTTVEIVENAIIPQEYLRQKTTIEPNKTALKEALANGELIDGVTLKENYNLQIK